MRMYNYASGRRAAARSGKLEDWNMKRMKKALVGLMAGCLLAALCACASTSTNASPSPSGEAASPAASAENTLVMATNAAFPPYEYYENGKIVGIDAEIAAKIAEKLGMTLKIEDMEFESIIAAVQGGKADMGMAGLTVDETRKKSVDFTTTYTTSHQVIIVPENSSIKDVDGLEGQTIGVQQSTTGDLYVTDQFGDKAVQRYSKGADAILALSQGKVDAVVIDQEPAKVFVQQNKGLKTLESEYATEEYAICVKKGNTELLGKIDTALQELIQDGTVQSILDKYIKA